MQYNLFSSNKFSLFSLSSGSSGNCYYIGNEQYGILIDVGIGPRVIKKRLLKYGIQMSSIHAVLITHDHFDHIKSVGYVGGKLNIPTYATNDVHQAIIRHPYITNDLNHSKRIIEKGKSFFIKDFRITPFEVSHDSTDNVGYFIEFGNEKLTLATDVGAPSEEIAEYIKKSSQLIIESNYDENLLRKGSYPQHLKERITNGRGHLSNTQAAKFVADNYTQKLKNIWLCHLSGDNNSPELAYEEMKNELQQRGIYVGTDVSISVFKRNTLSQKTDF